MRALGVLAAVLASGCLQHPAGRCAASADCASTEVCDGGVCVRAPAQLGNGSGGGADPTTFSTVAWASLAASTSASFGPVSASADAATGDVLVAAALDGRFDPWAAGTGAVAARLAGPSGALAARVAFPTFSHGALRTASLPGGGLLFAGAAVDPTAVGTYAFAPPPAGSLVLGRLGAAGDPVWVVTVDAAGAAGIAPVEVASRGGDLVLAGTGAGDFGCGGTAGQTFAAALSGADGSCRWSRGFANRTVSGVVALGAGDVAVAGLCTPSGPSFDPGGGTTCASGLYVAVLSGATGATTWARTSAGTGTVRSVRDLAAAPDGSVALVGDARGALALGGVTIDLGAYDASFAALLAPGGAARWIVHPVEAPYAALPDAASLDRCAFDGGGRPWVAGRYYGQPTLGGVRFTSCRAPCATAAYLARLDPATAAVGSFLPILIADTAAGVAYADALVLAATTGTVGLALRFSGDATVGPARWTTDAAGLGVVRVVP